MTASVIADYLRERGIKQKWLSDQLGISESRLSNILNSRAPLYADMFLDICEILEVSSEEFKDVS